jgi:hypothetical protein
MHIDPLNFNFERAMGNLPKAQALKLQHLNTYELVKKEKLAISMQAFAVLQERLLRQYLSTGKRGAMRRSFEQYLQVVAQGQTASA